MFSITFGGKCVSVTDGDTIVVEVKRRVRIRVLDLWSPETRTRDLEEKQRGLAAKAFLRDAIEGEDVEFTIPIDEQARFGESMSFGRVLASVDFKGLDVAEFMRTAGHGTKMREG